MELDYAIITLFDEWLESQYRNKSEREEKTIWKFRSQGGRGQEQAFFFVVVEDEKRSASQIMTAIMVREDVFGRIRPIPFLIFSQDQEISWYCLVDILATRPKVLIVNTGTWRPKGMGLKIWVWDCSKFS